jgi:hypothetical protein
MLAATLSTLVLGALLSTFLLIGRTGFDQAAYARINSRVRVALERFDHDVRLARDVRWSGEHRIRLLLPEPGGGSVTYAYVAAADPAAPGSFIREVEGAAPEVLLSDVEPDIAFSRHRLPGPTGAEQPATSDLDTKQIGLRLRALGPTRGRSAPSQLAFSARCVLRNKSPGT